MTKPIERYNLNKIQNKHLKAKIDQELVNGYITLLVPANMTTRKFNKMTEGMDIKYERPNLFRLIPKEQ